MIVQHTSSSRTALVPAALLALAPLVAPSAHAGEVDFNEHLLSTLADGVSSVCVSDVDGDGLMDVLAASGNSDTVTCYRNTGKGAFIELEVSTTTDGAAAVFAGDIDGDGDIDVVTASRNDNMISWHENNGVDTPTFSRHVISDNADRASSVYAIDLDNDGDLDVLSASSDDNKIAWYENDGLAQPGFTEHVISQTALGALSVKAADMDGDGDMDVLSASTFGLDKIAWYENDGATPPSFMEHVISTAAIGSTSVAVADLDGDGDPDVLSSSGFDDKIAWYVNHGGSPLIFSERVITTNADFARAVTTADVDGDGDIDVLSASSANDTVAWYDNDGNAMPSFTERIVSDTVAGATTLIAADIDGDNAVDIAVGASFSDRVSWFENLSETTTPTCPGDLDGTGFVDFHDLLAILAAWGLCPSEECPGDLDRSGYVGSGDLWLLLQGWGGCE